MVFSSRCSSRNIIETRLFLGGILRLTMLDARIPARFGMGVPIANLKLVTADDFRQPFPRTRFDDLRHFALLCCGCVEHVIMRRLPKHY